MKKFFKQLFYVPKHEKPTDENIIKMLLPPIAGIIMCAACLVGLTLAWFTTSVETPTKKITASNFDAAVTVRYENAYGEDAASVQSVYELESGTYYVELRPTGNGTGYVIVEADGEKYYTEPIRNEDFCFTLNVEGNVRLSFTPVWGTYSGEADVAGDGVLFVSAKAPSESVEDIEIDYSNSGSASSDSDSEETSSGDKADDTVSSDNVPDSTETSSGTTSPTETEGQTAPIDTTAAATESTATDEDTPEDTSSLGDDVTEADSQDESPSDTDDIGAAAKEDD